EYISDNEASDITIGTSGTPRDYNRDQLVLTLGTQQVFDNWTMDGEVVYSSGLYDQPTYFDGYFTLEEQTASIDRSNINAPRFQFNGPGIDDPASYTTDNYVNRHQVAHDKNMQAHYNASYKFLLAGEHAGSFKFGGRYQHKANDHTRSYYRYLLQEGSLQMSGFLSSYNRNDFFDNNYDLSNTIPDGYLMEDFYQQNRNLFMDDEDYIKQNTDPDSYSGTEYLGAAYVMGKLNVNKFEFITGVRYEQTGFDYKGNTVAFDEEGNYISTNQVNTSSTFDGFFPSLNVKYALDRHTNLRAAITRSLSRPSYYDLVPWEEIEIRRERIKKGNPGLQQATSTNLDFLFEHYLKSVGLIAGGVFYKRIDNYIYERSFIQQ
ncbi:MAG TPA: TonB-dependent receptor, partial [Anseongella sp.]|nr:TonB-dependent receptor [Anseongella sp.]